MRRVLIGSLVLAAIVVMLRLDPIFPFATIDVV